MRAFLGPKNPRFKRCYPAHGGRRSGVPKIETEKEGMDVVEEKNGLPPLPTILVGVPAVVNYPVELFVFLRQPMTSFTIICSGRNTKKSLKSIYE